MTYKQIPTPKHKTIKKHRIACGLTTEAAAQLCQVSRRTFCSWESGATPMHPIFWAWFEECAELDARGRAQEAL